MLQHPPTPHFFFFFFFFPQRGCVGFLHWKILYFILEDKVKLICMWVYSNLSKWHALSVYLFLHVYLWSYKHILVDKLYINFPRNACLELFWIISRFYEILLKFCSIFQEDCYFGRFLFVSLHHNFGRFLFVTLYKLLSSEMESVIQVQIIDKAVSH